jgi:hypothetical protein
MVQFQKSRMGTVSKAEKQYCARLTSGTAVAQEALLQKVRVHCVLFYVADAMDVKSL